jgi:CheY-like chemotaxis protein
MTNDFGKDNKMHKDVKILVAEDNPSNQKLIELLLSKLGYSCEIAEDGQKALDAVGSERYDLILMDMQMPNVTGYQATEEIRSMGLDVPVIALTANAMKGDRQKCIEAGCDDYLSKPINRQQLENIVNKYIKLPQQ